MSVVRRSVTSISWTVAANVLQLSLLFVRSIVLARWLPVDVFGLYTAALAIIAITIAFPNFGMEGAFLHRSDRVRDEREAAAVHFTLKFMLTAVWTVIMVIVAWFVPDLATSRVLLVLVAASALTHLTQTPMLILTRRVVHRRVATLNVLDAVLTVTISLVLAQAFVRTGDERFAIWALLSSNVITTLLSLIMYYVWRPVWRPSFSWDSGIVRYFLRFGGQNYVSRLLVQLIDRIDDLWTAYFLGQTALGYYSRAYRFATYPREGVSRPVNQVMTGTYAELKGDRARLSKVFSRTNALLIRSGFLLAGFFALIAPEFIHLVLTDKWLPMLSTFRLMLLFALLDPLKMTATGVMVAVGAVARPIPARLVQLSVLVAGLFLLGPRWGITGVALAVNIMTVVGMAILFWQAKDYVDFSATKLFLVPTIALVAGLAVGSAATLIPGVAGSDWRTGIVKAVVFVVTYGALLMAFESRETIALAKYVRRLRVEGRPVS